jgi:hypothetical protein
MSDIPFARDMFLGLADDLEATNPGASQIIRMNVSNYMYRTYTKPRSSVKSVPMTTLLAKSIKRLVASRPNLSTQQVANMFGVNPGRVSEAIAGKWDE